MFRSINSDDCNLVMCIFLPNSQPRELVCLPQSQEEQRANSELSFVMDRSKFYGLQTHKKNFFSVQFVDFFCSDFNSVLWWIRFSVSGSALSTTRRQSSSLLPMSPYPPPPMFSLLHAATTPRPAYHRELPASIAPVISISWAYHYCFKDLLCSLFRYHLM